jgi:tRNA(fMet)-specific endonuclease VapC
MPGYLLDTNHVGMAVDRAWAVGQRIFEARLAGLRVGTCLPVLCEIEVGIRQVRHKVKYRRDLNHPLRQLRLWTLDLKTARIYGDLYLELRRRGRVLSQVDLMVAALARQLKLTILTTDRDFEALPDIRTADWLKPRLNIPRVGIFFRDFP